MIDLKYFLFDWDDNILHMPTKIHLIKEGNPISVTTAEYASIRLDKTLKAPEDNWELAFREFRDNEDFTNFFEDTMTALSTKSFGPSFSTFKKTLIEGRLYCIITARGNASEAIRRGVEAIIEHCLSDDEQKLMILNIQKYNELAGINVSNEVALLKYLSLCGHIGVSSASFKEMLGGSARSPEEGKKRAIKIFIKKALKTISISLEQHVSSIAFGFSDDDEANIKKIAEFMSTELKEEYPHIKFRLFDTSKGHEQKIKI